MFAKCLRLSPLSPSTPSHPAPINFSPTALTDPSNQWKYCPSVPASLILFALFALSTLTHIYQAFRYRKAFCWVLIMGGLWETLSFASRIVSAHRPTEKGVYDASFLLLIISPLLSKFLDSETVIYDMSL